MKQLVNGLELSGVKMWAVRFYGDGPRPTCKIQRVFENHMIEDMSPATESPRFADQRAITEGRNVGTEIEKDFVNDLGRQVNRVSVALVGSRSFRASRGN